jgi:hypothetical protein
MDDVWCATNYTKKEIQKRGKKEKKNASLLLHERVEFVLFVCKLLDMSFPSNGNWVPPSGYAEAFAKDLGNSPEKIYSPLMLLTWSYEHYE